MKKLLGLFFTMILAVTLFACAGETTTTTPTTAAPTTTAPTTAAPTTTTVAPDKYSEGVYFEGVKLLGDYEFSLTIDPEELPYYYETLYAAYGPMPMHVLAPSYAYIDSGDDGATLVAAFAKIDDIIAVNGYRYYPTVTAGPYKFVSFVNQVVTVVIDPLFKGDYNGSLPTIEKIIQKRINQTTDVQQVIDGEVDLVTGVIEGAKIEAAKAASTTGTHFFNRNGYGLLAMTCDFGPTMDVKVRQAVAHLTDRQYVTDQVLSGYGSVVFSEYGAAQWMFQESQQWVLDTLNPYVESVADANELLDETEWKFESNGTTAWDSTKATVSNEYYRYNADKEVLELKHFGTENNTVSDSLRDSFNQNMPLAGIKYSHTQGTFDTLLDHFYFGFELGDDRTYHLFNLATNFDTAFDPYYSWHSDYLNTWYNSQGVDDEDLDALIMTLREIDPTSATAHADYLAAWRDYQVRWNELIPSVPLYSNQYYQVFDVALQGVEQMTPFYDWSAAICDIKWTTDTANDQLIVGVPEMNGEFMPGFGNSSYDNWIRGLIYGYGTYAVTPGGEIVLNPTVVEDLDIAVDAVSGAKTYTFTIADDLLWSDGVSITAADFVFSILFQASAEWARAGATSSAGQGLVGYDVYATGEPLA